MMIIQWDTQTIDPSTMNEIYKEMIKTIPDKVIILPKELWVLQDVNKEYLTHIRDEINDEGSGYFCHANQKKSSTQTYASTPRSAGCNVSDGQVNQDIFSTLVNLSPALESVKYTIQSMSNMGE